MRDMLKVVGMALTLFTLVIFTLPVIIILALHWFRFLVHVFGMLK